MKPRDYCCCAIPTINAGIYTTLIEQFVLGILVGVLAFTTPSIVGAVTPSFAPWLLGGLSILSGVVQIFGFLGVAREKTVLYRRYVSLHTMSTLAAFSVALAWIILSATRHSTAKSNCIRDFFPADSSDTSEADTLCNIFPWVDIGLMGGLWVLLAILQLYLYTVLSSYGTSQRRDHEKYDQLNNPTLPLNNIPLNTRNDPWDSRPSSDSIHSPVHQPGGDTHHYNHVRQESTTSMSDVMNQPYQQPTGGFSNIDGYAASYPPPHSYR